MSDTAYRSLESAIDRAIAYAIQKWPRLFAMKSIGQVVKEYDDLLNRFVYDAFNGKMSATDLARSHRGLIRSLSSDVVAEGLREGEIDPEDLEPDEQAEIDAMRKDWVDSQLSYVRDFANAATEAGTDSTARAKVLDRLSLWVDALRTLGEMVKAWCNRRVMCKWRFGATEQHCDTCRWLSHQKPHRLRWFLDNGYIPRERGSATLECGGWQCDCSIVNAKTGEVML